MPELSVSTVQLQALVNKASQCVGANKLIPITSMIGIRASKDVLTLYTTDGTNNLYVSLDVVGADTMNIVVNADTFIKLVNKITSDFITLDVVDNALVVSGNGSYKIALSMDDSGNILEVPSDILVSDNVVGSITQNVVQTIQATLKASLSSNSGSIYTNYFVGDFVCATDRAMMGVYKHQMFNTGGSKFLFTNSFVDLLAIAGGDVTFIFDEDSGVFIAKATNFTLTTKAQTDCSEFNVEGINKMMNIDQDSFCKLRKKELLDLLDRLVLFVSDYDDGAIYLHFEGDGINISSMSSNGVENISYTESKNIKDKTIKISIHRLIAQLKSYTSDIIELYFGSDVCIKLCDGDVTQVIALMR